MRQIVLFFLAHEGIRFPKMWIDWRREFKDGWSKILFYSMTEQRYPGWRHLKPVKTNWCGESLVEAVVEGFAQILDDDKKQNIHLSEKY